MMGGSSFPVMTPGDLDTHLDADSLGAKGYFIGSGVVTVIDDRTCIVQFALRVAQFYMHESCGKCTPCRVGTKLARPDPARGRERHRLGARPRPRARRLRPDHRQVPVRARRLGRDAGRELRDEVPRRVPRARRAGLLPVRARLAARRPLRADRPARRFAHARIARRRAGMSAPELVRVTIDEREVHVPKGTGIVETALAGGDRDPGLLLRAAARARRSARAACASSRSRGCRSRRPAAR